MLHRQLNPQPRPSLNRGVIRTRSGRCEDSVEAGAGVLGNANTLRSEGAPAGAQIARRRPSLAGQGTVSARITEASVVKLHLAEKSVTGQVTHLSIGPTLTSGPLLFLQDLLISSDVDHPVSSQRSW